jgi:hypothetical protein
MRSSADYARHAEECQNMAACVRSEAEKVAWLKLAESWLRVMRTQAELSPDEQFDAALTASGTGQDRSETSH